MPTTNKQISEKNATRTEEEIQQNKNYQWNDETSTWDLKQGATPDDDIVVGLL